MLEIVKVLLKAINNINDPLKFWAFYGIIACIILWKIFDNPKLIEKLARLISRKIGKKQFSRLVKTTLWFLFIMSVLTNLLAFLAPIILQKITINTSELSNQVLAAEGRILGSLELDHKLANAFERFETREYEKARSILDLTPSVMPMIS